MDLATLTIVSARKLLDAKKISSVELTKLYLKQIKAIDPQINACLEVYEKDALANAKLADIRIANGESNSLLGIPYFLKDNMLVCGKRCTAGSKMLENYLAPYDATVVKKLKAAGAVLLGKTNLDEFAHGSSTENSAFFVTKNPWNHELVAGGSSGGSAAALAANMCLFALGSDTGGSVRHPASFCGIYGLKPTYGSVSRFGLIAMTSSTDVIGPMAKTTDDLKLVWDVIKGEDEYDNTTRFAIAKSPKIIKLGIPKEYYPKTLNVAVRKIMDEIKAKYQAAKIELVDISLPMTPYAVAAYYIITPAEVSANLARLDGSRYGLAKTGEDWREYFVNSRTAGFGDEAKRRIMIGTYVLSAGYYDAYYKSALRVKDAIKLEFAKAFKKCDLILTPMTPGPAFKIGEKAKDPLAMYLEDVFSIAPSLAGLPALSFPAGKIDGLPIGAQLIGPEFSEDLIMQIAI